MKKAILFLSVLILLSSCRKNTRELNLEIKRLTIANDSLRKITNNLKDKFIFDEIGLKIVPSEKNNNKIGSYYEGDFVLFAYNKNDEILFSTKLDSSNGKELINPEILKRNYGGYHFKFKLKQEKNDIHFNVNIGSKIGRNLDGLLISDKKDAY